MDNNGTATFYHFGFMVLNQNGVMESLQLPTIVPGCSSGNIKDMTSSLAAVGLEWAQKTELTTDGTSKDDKGEK